MYHILLVEDNITTAKHISAMLPSELYFTSVARSIEQAQSYLGRNKYDLVVLDRNLPDGDGLEIAEDLYWSHREIALLILSEKGALDERIRGLRKGADDYLPKPFSMDELILRIQKLLTKVKQLDAFALHVGQVSVFPQSGTVCVKDETIQLRKRECEILSFLIRHKNRIVSKNSLVENVWREDLTPVDSTIAVYIRRIRMRLGKTGYQIKTIRGFGYIITDK